MALNFAALAGTNSADSVLPPREIFSSLPSKAKKYQYPRDVQAEVWKEWFERREEPELVIKMNTGGGKTVVGLLILKSCLNESRGPAVYVAPDLYLVGQVLKEAKSLGLEVTDDPDSLRFIRGKAILVTNIHKIVNGKSIFGVGDEGAKIKIGSLLVDDAHACLAVTEQQFTMESSGAIYDTLFHIFRDSLFLQSPALALEVEQQTPFKEIRVPFWTWIDKISQVESALFTHREDSDILFTWPLIKNHLRLCRCVFGRGKVEISPPVLPISVIPSIQQARRRIFMSATLADDSVLVSHFDLQTNEVFKAVSPSTADDIGDRMILVPQELNSETSDEDIKAFAVDLSSQYNVVVLVASTYRASFWQKDAQLILTTKNLEAGVSELRSRHVGLVVIINRYDGIDLPEDACRVLIIDGLPDFRRLHDKIEEGVLQGSDTILRQRIQRIEQGMGRGIRSNDDNCVVLLMGKTLTSFLYAGEAKGMFTSPTQKQLELSEKLAEQIRGKPLSELREVVDYNLSRNPDWIKAAKGALVGLQYSTGKPTDPQIKARREAFNAACVMDYTGAVATLQKAVALASDSVTKGWTLAHLAEYYHFVDQVESQAILKSAVKRNSQVAKPLAGIMYEKLLPSHINQAQQCIDHINANFTDRNRLIIAVNGLLDELVFQPETSSVFEQAIKQLGLFLGFHAQRPEAEFGKGPDNLWEVGALNYFVIECKNGATSSTICKHDCNQLNGSMIWFGDKYDSSCTAMAVMIHPINIFEHACSPHEKTRIMTRQKLDDFKAAIRSFFVAINQNVKLDIPSVSALLAKHELSAERIISNYTVTFKVNK